MSVEILQGLFLKRYGARPESVVELKGDGSARRLYRLSGRGTSAVGVLGSDVLENRAFLGFSRHFASMGLPVPEIYEEAPGAAAYLEQDLGDTTLFGHVGARRAQGWPEDLSRTYRDVVRWLPRFQITAGRGLDYGLCHPRAAFDLQSMLWDLNYFKYYFLRLAGISFNEQALEDDFRRFAAFLLKAPADYFLYRDFQSRNVMLLEGKPYFIDYQGGRRGALQYDVASLLYDAKADLPPELRRELLELYLSEASALAPIDRAAFLAHFDGFAYIRIFQALGAYGLRGFYERKGHFLQSIPYALRNIEELLRREPLRDYKELRETLKRLVALPHLRRVASAPVGLTVHVQSFSYRDGIPIDETGHGGGFVFDCRALPNPGRYAHFAALSGKDEAVAQYLRQEGAVSRFLSHACALAELAVEDYRRRRFTSLSVAFGCTGGRHRSVYCAEQLAKRLRERGGVHVELRHREEEKARLLSA